MIKKLVNWTATVVLIQNMDKEIEDTMEGWNQEQENKRIDEKFNNA